MRDSLDFGFSDDGYEPLNKAGGQRKGTKAMARLNDAVIRIQIQPICCCRVVSVAPPANVVGGGGGGR